MEKRLLASEPGYNQYWIQDGDKVHISTEANTDVDLLLKINKEEANQFDGYKGDFHKVASIDPMTLAKLMTSGISSNPERMKKWLNDPDNRFYRTSKGKV